MKTGGHPRAVAGFTIVETLIVLAVTSALFLSAVILIAGRTNHTEFMTATNDLKQELQQMINETASGFFPNSGSFKCSAGGGTMPILQNTGQAQGTNGDCVFLGKAVQIGATDSSFADDILVYAITGNRLQNGTQNEVTDLNGAMPEAVAPGNANNLNLTGITTQTPLENGLSIASMKYAGGDISGFAFLTTLASYTAGGQACTGLCTGSQGLTLYAISSPAVNTQTSAAFVDELDSWHTTPSSTYNPASQITLCFNSGTTNQSAVYTIGNDSDTQAVDMTIQDGACS